MPTPKKKAKDSWKKLGMDLADAQTFDHPKGPANVYTVCYALPELHERARALRKASKRGRG